MTNVLADRIERVRAFNRFYTNVIGVVRGSMHDTEFTLTEGRVIFELGKAGSTDVAELRAEIDIDRGQLSRVLARLEDAGVLERSKSATDARRQVVRLTRAGDAAFGQLDRGASESVEVLLRRHSEAEQARLVGAMSTIQSVLDETPQPVGFTVRPPRSGDYGWVIERHGATYAAEYGWDASFEALVARTTADRIDHRDDPREGGWIAEIAGERVGCVFCAHRDETTAQLRLLLVEPKARGTGVGTYLVNECVRFAGQTGHKRIVLWTMSALGDARRVYERAGFGLVSAEPFAGFGKQLQEQTWAMDL